MKKRLAHLLAAALMVWGLSSCMTEDVLTEANQGNQPALAGAVGDEHPALDTLCQRVDTIWLMSEDGSFFVNKCYSPMGPVACQPNQPKWGFLTMQEGYLGSKGYYDCEFTMAPGWYGQLTTWKVSTTGDFSFDGNGVPVVANDWGNATTTIAQNRWKLRFPIEDMPSTGFDVIIKVKAVRLNLMGVITNGSATSLWAKNPTSNTPGSPYYSAVSPLAIHFTPERCLERPVEQLTECRSLKVGVPELSSCKTLTANTTGLTGTLTYSWSTGATTPSITACPNATTTYAVTISSNGFPVRVVSTTLNVSNIACGNGNSPLHKVWVCHLPPGNPANQQDICIDWSGVPAHVAEYRPAGSLQGHNSGCRIGKCADNPCL
ncbi:MAG: hypothetical protein U0176_08035 [Bacteroidia bacterium]